MRELRIQLPKALVAKIAALPYGQTVPFLNSAGITIGQLRAAKSGFATEEVKGKILKALE